MIGAQRPVSAGAAIRALVCGYATPVRARRVLVVLQAFIDDSASDIRDDKRLVLAGYIQTAEAWEKFSDDWAAVLAQPPALKSLHMTGGFKRFSKAEKEQKIDALVAVLTKYKPASIECSVSRKDYTEVLRPKAPHDLRHPYFPCFVGVLYGVAATLVDAQLVGPVDLIFDEQGNVGPAAALWYQPLKHLDKKLAATLGGAPIFRNDEQVLPLQAADLLAWHVRRLAEPDPSQHQIKVADAIRFSHRSMEVPREMLVKWADSFSKVPGIEKTRGAKGSTKDFMSHLVSTVPPERLVPTLAALQARARWLRPLRWLVLRIGLRRFWKKIAKRRKTFR